MPKTIIITGDSIPLPKRLAKKWQGAKAMVSEQGVRILPSKTAFNEMLTITSEVGQGVTQKDLDDAIVWARQQKTVK
jgi:hypothetical protein